MTDFYLPDATDVEVSRLASQLVQLPSVNPMGAAADPETCYEWRVTRYLEQLLRHWGLQTERHEVNPAGPDHPPRENLLAALPGDTRDNDRPLILYEVHQDTVPVDGMTIRPWSGERRDGRVYGRGACDVKGGMASMLAAMARLSLLPAGDRPRLVLACTINEEHGFTGAVQLAETFSSGRSVLLDRVPDVAVVAEPTLLQVVVTHKGTVRWRLHAVGRAAHSSAPQRGRNAIYDMAELLRVLRQYAQQEVPQLANHALLGHPTMNVGLIGGGVSVNTVPDRCWIEIDRRLLPEESSEAAYEHALAYLRHHAPPEIAWEAERPYLVAGGLTDTHNQALAADVVAAAAACGCASTTLGVPYGTDAATFASHGVPSVVFGPGDVAQAHTADEWVAIEQLETATSIYMRLAQQVGRSCSRT